MIEKNIFVQVVRLGILQWCSCFECVQLHDLNVHILVQSVSLGALQSLVSEKFSKYLRVENVPIFVQVVRLKTLQCFSSFEYAQLIKISSYLFKSFVWGHYNALYVLKEFSSSKCPHTRSEREFSDIIDSGKFSKCLRIENVPILVQVVCFGTLQCFSCFESVQLIQMSPYASRA